MKQILVIISCKDITGYSDEPTTEYTEIYNVDDNVSLKEFVESYDLIDKWNYDIVKVKNAFVVSESLNPMEMI